MKILFIILAGTFGFGAIAEIGLRITQGLGNPPLYIADRDIGYLLAPNQKLRRGGNLIATNSYSMRDRELKPEKEREKKRIFLLGDSVVNGSWWTDQSKILPALVEEKLQKTQSNKFEVFNASTNSWGPRNELAYIQRYGLFDTDLLILVINTDDLFATEPTSLVVGKSPSYPDKAPTLALIELYQFYLAPPRQIPELEKMRSARAENLTANLAAIQEIKAIAQKSNTQFILALTPLLREFEPEGSTSEETAARMSLEKLVEKEKINYLDFLKIWSDFPQPEFLYRDFIHPSPQGNTKVVEQVILSIEQLLITSDQ
ncbi:SGNH/GDSL hydrolase family protein [Waterburya agarophytonicola K14]|uniref:SGNH/GDSL hydrolase family protein n=1 Tax=Waterburya agarophytonicola KI4 TaxID=2874699 RepID=A0A964BNE6_9CYAN|nr:SGNH/GDSL hydrolase family protein [Waterburya agarophytonicola]MCC0176629.1 SGNH/GDSL hydrolase family protein [Waterburya agarophytonicola KI4]